MEIDLTSKLLKMLTNITQLSKMVHCQVYLKVIKSNVFWEVKPSNYKNFIAGQGPRVYRYPWTSDGYFPKNIKFVYFSLVHRRNNCQHTINHCTTSAILILFYSSYYMGR